MPWRCGRRAGPRGSCPSARSVSAGRRPVERTARGRAVGEAVRTAPWWPWSPTAGVHPPVGVEGVAHPLEQADEPGVGAVEDALGGVRRRLVRHVLVVED